MMTARSDDQFASIKTHFREMWNVKQEEMSQTICQHFRVSDYGYLNKSWPMGFLSQFSTDVVDPLFDAGYTKNFLINMMIDGSIAFSTVNIH